MLIYFLKNYVELILTFGFKVGTNFSVVISPLCNPETSSHTVYSSPHLTDYPFDTCNNCYSPPVEVHATGLSIPVSTASVIKLVFENNDRNLQILLPLNFVVGWL